MGYLYAPGDHVNHMVARATLLNYILPGRKWRRFSMCSMARRQASSARERMEERKRKGVRREREVTDKGLWREEEREGNWLGCIV